MDQATAGICWKGTEVIRKYQPALPTFLGAELPYIFAAEHQHIKGRISTVNGYVLVNAPQIFIPFYLVNHGPNLRDGFQDINFTGPISFLRLIGFPYSFIDNKIEYNHLVEDGNLQGILKRHENELEAGNDIETALIKGVYGGVQVSLVRYLLELSIKSAPTNAREALRKLRKEDTPIREKEGITPAEIDKLFNPNL